MRGKLAAGSIILRCKLSLSADVRAAGQEEEGEEVSSDQVCAGVLRPFTCWLNFGVQFSLAHSYGELERMQVPGVSSLICHHDMSVAQRQIVASDFDLQVETLAPIMPWVL